MQHPEISIITPLHNSGRFLKESIESVLRQTFSRWELILIDDCSTDESAGICQHYVQLDSRIKYFRLGENLGVAAARNKGTEAASGRFIAFLDSDDVWHSQKLEKQINYIKHFNTPLTYSSYHVIDENNNIVAEYDAPTQVCYKLLLKSNFIGNLTGIYDVSHFGKRYMNSYHHEDYIFWLALLKEIPEARGIPEKLAKYRKTSSSLSSNKLKTITWQWKIYREVEQLSITESFYYLLFYIYFGLTKYKKVRG